MKIFSFQKKAMLLETYGFSIAGGKKHSECDFYVNIDFKNNSSQDSYSFAFQDKNEASSFFDEIKKETANHNYEKPFLFTLNNESHKLIKEPDRLVIGKY